MTSTPASAGRAETAQALACLAPAAALISGAVYGVPTHTSAAAGWILLTSLPALILTLIRRPSAGVAGWPALLIVIGLALLHSFTRSDLDTFEARRALISLTCWSVLLTGAAGLGPGATRILARGLITLSASGLGFAWIDTLGAPLRAFAGTLENSGDLSETVLPGALLGYASLRSESRTWRLFGAATAALYLITVGKAPVLAGGLSFLTAAGLATLLGRSRGKALPVAALLIAIAAAAGTYTWAHRGTSVPATAAPGASAPAGEESSTLGGVAFRRLTWARIPSLVAEHPWIGAGPGQFARSFPPHRDPREIELSSHGRSAPISTEVEHAHNDWLEAFGEYGLIGGLAWLFLGALVVARGLAGLSGRTSPGTDPLGGAFALAGIGVVLNACFNSPFLEGPAFATAAPLLGVLLAGPSPTTKPRIGVPVPVLIGTGLSLYLLPQAWRMTRHGAALVPLADGATTVVDGKRLHTVEGKASAVELALAACPDSTIARTEAADLARSTGASGEVQLEHWQSVLEIRPHHLEALIAAGNLHARAGASELAQEHYSRAARVDPHNPQLAQNTLLLALRTGNVEGVLDGLARQGEAGTLNTAWLERSAAEMLLSGRPHLGLPLLERAHPEWDTSSAESAYALAKSLEDRPDRKLLADALLAHAHFSWAREHADAGDPASAVRSYRQCLRISNSYPDLHGSAQRIRLELSAAESLRGAPPSGSERAVISEVQRRELPDWAREELARLGWPGVD